MSKSIKELHNLIKAELEAERQKLENFKGCNNPQIVEMRHQTEGKIEALETVYEYTKNGSKAYFAHRI